MKMKTLARKVLRFGAVAAALTGATMFAGAGCADNESSLFIYGIKTGQAPGCVVDNSITGTYVYTGIMDLAFRGSYTAHLLVGNQLVKRGSSDQVRTETSRIELHTAEVTVEDVQGATVSSYTVPISGIVTTGTGNDPGFGITDVLMLDPTVATKYLSTTATSGQALVVSKVKLFGRTLGGTELASNLLEFPIELCFGCLVANPTVALDGNNVVVESCSLTDEDPIAVCTVGQDYATALKCPPKAGTLDEPDCAACHY